MADAPLVRILASNDFVGSFFPQPTSYGSLPGVVRFRQAAAELRAQARAGIWLDAGDIAQGCALNHGTDGAWGWRAARELEIDAAALGNHELDWGGADFERWSAELPFPFLAANLEIGLAGSTLIEAGELAIGVVGLTDPRLDSLHPEYRPNPDTVGIVREHAARLRRDGAWRIVLVLHDGVDETIGAGALYGDPSRIESLCRELHGVVDAVVAGHTLMRRVGRLAGVPYLQPWAFGSELAWVDFREDGSTAIGAREVAPPSGGGEVVEDPLYRTLCETVVGVLEDPLAASVGGQLSLPTAIAEGLVCVGECDAAVVPPWDVWNQPPRDGLTAFLPAGSVSEADLLRATPLCGRRSAWGGQLLAADMRHDVAASLSRAVAVELGYAKTGADAAVALAEGPRPLQSRTVRLAAPPYFALLLDRISGQKHAWREVEAQWSDGLRSFFANSALQSC